MTAVVRLVERRNAETVAMLQELLRMSLAEDLSLALSFRSGRGIERCVITGAYKANPALAVNAAFRLGLLCTELQPELR